MSFLLRVAAYLFHPLWMPILGVLLYYFITPRFLEPEFMRAKIMALFIITVLIPIISFFLLRNLGVVKTIHLETAKERKYPLMIQCLLLLLLLKMVFLPYDELELYYFFTGVLFTTLTALFLAFFNFKVSLHQMAISGILMFTVGLSLHFQLNLLLLIALLVIINGWVASSRLHTVSHTSPELVIGFFIGAVPQLLMFTMWL